MKFDSVLVHKGNVEKAASGVLAILPCSRTESTLCAPNMGSGLDLIFFCGNNRLIQALTFFRLERKVGLFSRPWT